MRSLPRPAPHFAHNKCRLRDIPLIDSTFVTLDPAAAWDLTLTYALLPCNPPAGPEARIEGIMAATGEVVNTTIITRSVTMPCNVNHASGPCLKRCSQYYPLTILSYHKRGKMGPPHQVPRLIYPPFACGGRPSTYIRRPPYGAVPPPEPVTFSQRGPQNGQCTI